MDIQVGLQKVTKRNQDKSCEWYSSRIQVKEMNEILGEKINKTVQVGAAFFK